MPETGKTDTDPAGKKPMTEEALRAELKSFIVQHLRMVDVDPASLDDDSPLVGSGLDMDSVDLLELVTGVEKKYGVRFEDPDLVQEVFSSVSSIASHIASQRGSR
jgi:acyl carrier protein